MPWYRVGSVAITAGQTTVTGTGTAFSANARVGDAFQGPDGRWYEVANIASATVLSILPAYQGATVAGGSYGLAPMQGYVKESADRLRQLVDQWGSTLAGLGSVSTENVVPVAKGGTGGTNPALARSGLGLKSAAIADIVGAVSQSGGVPTGAIVERGNSANGEYVKFADGTMICTSLGRALEFFNPSNLFTRWTYPVAFAATPMVLVNQSGSSIPFTKQATGCYAYTRTNTSALCSIASVGQFVSSDASAGVLDVVAIGRWY